MKVKSIAGDSNCPCCSQKRFAECCEPYLRGDAAAPDPETLMRSRYTAFSLNDVSYAMKTWHPETKPVLTGEEPSDWVGLEIIASGEQGDEGRVEFKAKLIHGKSLETLHEASDFYRVDGQWLYHSGEFLNEKNNVQKIAQKEPCPCGSGQKFKHCHGNK